MAWDQNENGTNVIIGQPGLSVENYEAARAVASNLLATAHNIMIAGRDSESDGGGGQFTWDSNSLDNTNDGISLRPNDKGLLDSGRLIRSNQNPVNVKWFGAKGDGITDDTTAFANTIANAMDIFVPPGTYLVSSIDFNTITTKNRSIIFRGSQGSLFANNRTLIKSNSVNDHLLMIGDTDLTASSSRPMQVLISDIDLDCDLKSNYGLRITAGTNINISRLTSSNGKKSGIFIDGTLACDPIAIADLNAVLLDSCVTNGNGSNPGDAGILISAPGVVLGSFDNFRITNYQSMSGDYCGLRVKGTPGVIVNGGSVIQPGGVGIEVLDSSLTIDATYIEAGGVSLSVTSTNFGDSVVNIRGGSVITNPTVDSKSSVIYEGSKSNSAIIGVERYSISKSCDDQLWGPPNMAGKTGSNWYKGQLWKDSYGITWVCVVAGSTNVARFIPRDGKIIRPLDAVTLNLGNGQILWWAQDDMVLRDVTVVCGGPKAYTCSDNPALQYLLLTTFAGGNQMNLIGQSVAGVTAQLPLSVMTDAINSTVVTSNKNAAVGAVMNNKEELFFSGSAVNVSPAAGNYIKQFMGVSPAHYTEGANGPALLLLNVYPLRYA